MATKTTIPEEIRKKIEEVYPFNKDQSMLAAISLRKAAEWGYSLSQ